MRILKYRYKGGRLTNRQQGSGRIGGKILYGKADYNEKGH